MSAQRIPGEDDRGAEGPAALARTVELVEIAGRSRGSAAPGEVVVVRRLREECLLDTLLARGGDVAWLGIDHTQWRVGLRFRRLWLASCRGPRLTARYEARVPPSSDHLVPGEASAGARAELGAALKALTSAEWQACVRVCGCDEPAGKGGLSVLRAGLDKLVDLWDADRSRGR